MQRPEPLGLAEAIREFEALLISVALGHRPDRGAAMTYTRLRNELLRAGDERTIPGFVNQCASVASFQTFISLYHPLKTARQEFIEQSFRPHRAFDRRPLYRATRSFNDF